MLGALLDVRARACMRSSFRRRGSAPSLLGAPVRWGSPRATPQQGFDRGSHRGLAEGGLPLGMALSLCIISL